MRIGTFLILIAAIAVAQQNSTRPLVTKAESDR